MTEQKQQGINAGGGINYIHGNQFFFGQERGGSRLFDRLPPNIDRLVGRQDEMARMRCWLGDGSVRLVGITAAGGFGKTFLAAAVYAEPNQQESPPDSIQKFEQKIWLSFSEAYSFAVAGRWLLEQLGVQDDGSTSEADLAAEIVGQLSTRKCLVVWDNLESLLDEQGNLPTSYQYFLGRWLSHGAKSSVVLTSRVGVEVPDNRAAAVRWERLQGLTLAAGLELLKQGQISGQEEDLQKFVQLADGHPLLLDLTVGWLRNRRKNLSPEVSYALGKDDLFRLAEIVGEHRGDPEASVGKILGASVGLLSTELRVLWLELSVYRGSFGLGAAQAMVAGVRLEDLFFLARCSLLEETISEEWQFSFLPLLKTYAQIQAGEIAPAHAKALGYFQMHCEPITPTAPAVVATPYLEAFHHFCELGRYGEALELLDFQTVAEERYSSCDMLLKFRGLGSDRSLLLELYLNIVDKLEEPWQRANTLKAIGDVQQFLDQREAALENYGQALELYRSVGARLGEANTLQVIGDVQQFLKQCEAALENYGQALELYRAVGDRLGEANTLKAIGDVQQFLKQCEAALENYGQALELYRAVGARVGEANTLQAIGDVQQFLKQCEAALEHYGQALELYRAVGVRLGEANTLRAIGKSLQTSRFLEEANSKYQASLEIYQTIGDKYSTAMTLQLLGNLYNEMGRPKDGFIAAHKAQQILQEINLESMAYPQWLKSFIAFAEGGWGKLALCFVAGLIAFPLIIIWLLLLITWRFIRSKFRKSRRLN